jgi:hypothetical protein
MKTESVFRTVKSVISLVLSVTRDKILCSAVCEPLEQQILTVNNWTAFPAGKERWLLLLRLKKS